MWLYLQLPFVSTSQASASAIIKVLWFKNGSIHFFGGPRRCESVSALIGFDNNNNKLKPHCCSSFLLGNEWSSKRQKCSWFCNLQSVVRSVVSGSILCQCNLHVKVLLGKYWTPTLPQMSKLRPFRLQHVWIWTQYKALRVHMLIWRNTV